MLENTLFVLVLYNTPLQESDSTRCILAYMQENGFPLNLLIYDNGVTNQQDHPLLQKELNKASYLHNPQNPGLACAYNKGLELAIRKGNTWLTLLDQDTIFDKEYMEELSSILSIKPHTNIAAIVPHIILAKKKVILSPHRQNLIGLYRPLRLSCEGIQRKKISALNSCSTIRVDFLQKIQGFETFFNLDMLDYWLFKQIHAHKQNIYVLKTKVHHKLSFHDNNYIDLDRYKLFLKKEQYYFRHYEESRVFLLYKLRLLYRAFKQYYLLRKKEHAIFTLRCLVSKG